MKAFLAPRGVVHWFLAGVSEQSHWLGTPNSGVSSDLEGGSITNMGILGFGNKRPFEAGIVTPTEALVFAKVPS